jgi:hypothetical protein
LNEPADARVETVALRLPEFLAQLANHVIFKLGILRQARAQQGNRQSMGGDRCHRLDRIRVCAFFREAEYIVVK